MLRLPGRAACTNVSCVDHYNNKMMVKNAVDKKNMQSYIFFSNHFLFQTAKKNSDSAEHLICYSWFRLFLEMRERVVGVW